MGIYKFLMGNGGIVCKCIGSGDCDNCHAKDIKLKVIPLNSFTLRIYKWCKNF